MNDKNNNTIDPMSTDDATITAIIFQCWREWIDGMEGQKMEGQKRILSPADKVFLATYQVSETSPVALMFFAFEAGLDCGIDLADKMNILAGQAVTA